MKANLILGGPGTGKTTRLLSIMEKHLDAGVKPERIAFVSFTKKATLEARDRACDKFGFMNNDLPNFKTLHAMAYRELGISKRQVMQRKDYRELGRLLGVRFSFRTSGSEAPASEGADGDRMKSVCDYAQAKCISIEDAWHEVGTELDWFALDRFSKTIRDFKQQEDKLDFGDMIAQCSLPVDVDVAIIDEAQDLTTLQWRQVNAMFSNVPSVYIAGDDDQAIYSWAGADIKEFLGLNCPREVLSFSHRLPVPVFDVAEKVAHRISTRYDKQWQPSTHGGTVQTIGDAWDLDINIEQSWLFLARNACYLQQYEDVLRLRGVPYRTKGGTSVDPAHVTAIRTWEMLRRGDTLTGDRVKEAVHLISAWCGQLDNDVGYTIKDLSVPNHKEWFYALDEIETETAEYYRSIMRNGCRLDDTPDIYVGTIHSVKGGEADNVVLSTDMTSKSYESYTMNPDNEERVFYVGVTRTKKNLYLTTPQSDKFFTL